MGRARDRVSGALLVAGFVVATAATAWNLGGRGVEVPGGAEVSGADVGAPDLAPTDDVSVPDGATSAEVRPPPDAPPTGRLAAPRARVEGPGVPDGARVVEARGRRIDVSGVVRDPDGVPLSGVTVELRTVPDGEAVGWSLVAGTTLDECGRFALRGTVAVVPPYGRLFRVHAEPLDPRVGPSFGFLPGTSEPFELDASGRRSDVEVRLGRGAGFDVALVDQDGTSVSEARVRVRPDGDERGPEADAGAARKDGVFRVRGLRAGAYRVAATSRLFPDVVARAEVAAGETVALRLTVAMGARVRGVVVGPGGRPVPGAILEVLAPAPASPDAAWAAIGEARADDAGRFDLPRLPDGPLRVRARARGLRSPGDGVAVVAGARDVRVALASLGRARLALVAADGRSLEGVPVTVTTGPVDGSRAPVREDYVVVGGALVVEGLHGDDEQVVVDVDGYAPLVRTARASPGEEVDLGRATLSAGRQVEGVVVDPDGRPLPRVRVVSAGGRVATLTDGDGRFVLRGLPDADVDVVVTPSAALPVEVHVPAGSAGPVRVTVAVAGRLRGTLAGADGTPAGGVRILFRAMGTAGEDAAPAETALRTDDDGSFDVVLAPGRYEVEVADGADAEALGAVEVTGRGDVARTFRRSR